MGSPHKKINYIIVGGTNGKGSVSTITAKIIELSGYKTGLYTSPHLIRITERIKINGKEIEYPKLDDLLGQIIKSCEEIKLELSYFELITVCAFVYFYENNIDIGILEVGMGGRWDATNVIEPLLSVITNVTIDHREFLGETIEEITFEKVELIKNQGIVVTGCQNRSLEILREKCEEKSAKYFILGQNFKFTINDNKTFNYKGENIELDDLKSKLKGKYQIINTTISIYCTEILNKYFNYDIAEISIRNAVKEVNIEGRMEYVDENIPVILDGCHNVDSVRKLVESLKWYYPESKFNFLISMLKSKNLQEFVHEIVQIADKIIYTELIEASRSYKTKEFKQIIEQYDCEYSLFNDPKEAYLSLLSYNKPFVVCGSLYLIGYLKQKAINK